MTSFGKSIASKMNKQLKWWITECTENDRHSHKICKVFKAKCAIWPLHKHVSTTISYMHISVYFMRFTSYVHKASIIILYYKHTKYVEYTEYTQNNTNFQNKNNTLENLNVILCVGVCILIMNVFICIFGLYINLSVNLEFDKSCCLSWHEKGSFCFNEWIKYGMFVMNFIEVVPSDGFLTEISINL